MSPATGAKIGRSWPKASWASPHAGAVASAACANQRQFARSRSATVRGRERWAASSSSASLRARTRAAPRSRRVVTRVMPAAYVARSRTARLDKNRVETGSGARPFRGFRFYDRFGQRRLFPFGHGLSYARFRFDDLSARTSRGDRHVVATVRVRNTSARAGSTIAQAYVTFPPAADEPPQ
jgi:hypothetical protein